MRSVKIESKNDSCQSVMMCLFKNQLHNYPIVNAIIEGIEGVERY